MANVSITLDCNQDCPYCFARGSAHRLGSSEMSEATFTATLDRLEAAGLDQLRMLGGEPTLHSRFGEMIEQAVQRGFAILLFTNGRIPERAMAALQCRPRESVRFLLNTPGPQADELTAPAHLTQLFELFSDRVQLGYNMHTPDPRLDHLAPWIETYGLERSIRLGLAHGSPWSQNARLHPKDYERVGTRLATYLQQWSEANIRVDFDCGFVPCMFPRHMDSLAGVDLRDIGNRCNPIPDILPQGQAASCYVLSGDGIPNAEADMPLVQVRRQLLQGARGVARATIFKHCPRCEHYQAGRCRGGCLGSSLARSHPENQGATIAHHTPAKDRPAPKPWSLPFVNQSLEFWSQLLDDFSPHVGCVYAPMPARPRLSGRPAQPIHHLEALLRSQLVDVTLLLNALPLPAPARELWGEIEGTVRGYCETGSVTAICVADPTLAEFIRRDLPFVQLVASVMVDIHTPAQVKMLDGLFDVIVVASRVVRDIPALSNLRATFDGDLRLIVNEACLPGCPWRAQHFYEMASGVPTPRSLCEPMLQEHPELRQTGAWVLPQDLHQYDPYVDSYKLAGRVTLQDPAKYRNVLEAYIHRSALPPYAIGGGPASPQRPDRLPECAGPQSGPCRTAQ